MNSGTDVSLVDAALIYAEIGFRVHPIIAEGKLPLTEHGVKDATTNPDQIRAWWSKWPNANVGIATGRMAQEDAYVLVVDVDGEEGRESLELLLSVHGSLPDTLECGTGAGRHIYFFSDTVLPNSASKLGSKIDTRGEGGYVIAPPSVHANGKVYTWDDADLADFVHSEMAMLPTWIAEALEKPKWEEKPRGGTDFRLGKPLQNFLPGEGTSQLYENFVRLKLQEIASAPDGCRNQTYHDCIYALAPIVREGFAEEHYVEDQAKAAARSAGLGEREIDLTWRSGFDSGWMSGQIVEPSQKVINDLRRSNVLTKVAPTSIEAIPKRSKLVVTAASNLITEEVEFLWGDRLVRGAINLVAGTGGKGKSTLALHIARSITNGFPLPDSKGQASFGSVMLASYEDQPGQIIRQARVLDIDLDKLHIIEGTDDGDGYKLPFTPDDIPSLIDAMEDLPDVRMLIIDPWAEYMSENANREDEVRNALKPLQKVAVRRNITILIMCHLKKDSQDPDPINRISGNKGFTNRARSVLMVGDVPGKDRIAICHAKHNNSQRAATLLYRWDETKYWSKHENPFTFDDDTSNLTLDQIFAPQEQSTAEKCQNWLIKQLGAGPVEKQDILDAGEDERPKYTVRQIETAARTLKLKSSQIGNQYTGHGAMWSLS